MLVQHFSRSFNTAVREAVARGLVPFDWGASHHRRDLRALARGERSPATFTDKVRYKLARDRRPIARVYADKLAVRQYVRSRCDDVRLPELYGAYDTVQGALANVPAEPWVMKASHGSAMVLLCPTPALADRTRICRCAHEWLNTDYALRYWEWQYFRLPRRVMFEEYLGVGECAPDDYKLYVINQQVQLIEVDQGRFISHTRDFFDPAWNHITSRIGPAPVAEKTPPKPAQLERMIAIAEALSRDTDFLRVDLYVTRGDVYFGELTHSPAAGNFGFEDPALDAQLGSYWRQPARYI